MNTDFDQTQAVVLEDFEEDDLTDELESSEEKKPTAYIKVLFQKGLTETTYPLYEGDNIIGRNADSCHVCIQSKSLSKEHACVQITAGSHLISDKNSLNKTRRGKLFLRPEVWYELKHGDEIIFADVKCIYEISQQITAAVEETDSEADTSESLMLHHDVTEEHSFEITDKQADKTEIQKCYPTGKGNCSEVLETQVFSESEDEVEELKNRTEVVQETLLFEDSDSDTNSDHNMCAAATQAYNTENSNNSIDDSNESNDHDMNASATQAYSTQDKDINSNDNLPEATTQAYTETWSKLDEDKMRNEPTQLFVQQYSSRKEKKRTVNSLHKPCSPEAGTQSFEVAKNSLEGTQSFEEMGNKINNKNDSGDSNMRPTQVFEEDDDEVSKDAAGLFAVATIAYDGDDNNVSDGDVSVCSDADGPTQVWNLETPIHKTVTEHDKVTPAAVTNKFDVITPVKEHVKNIAIEICPTTETAILSVETPTQIIDDVPLHTVDEGPFKKIDKNHTVKTSANTSRSLQCQPDSNEIISTQVFDEPISTDINKFGQRKIEHQNRQPVRSSQPDNCTGDGIMAPTDSTLLVSETTSKESHPRKGRRRQTQQTVFEQPTKTVEGASDEQTQSVVPHSEICNLLKTEEEHPKTNSHNKHDEKQDTLNEDNKLSKNLCMANDLSDEPTQAYGIKEDNDTQKCSTDSAHEAVSVLEEPTQIYSTEDTDCTQIVTDNEKVEHTICFESNENEGATQIFYQEGTPQKFDAVEGGLGKTTASNFSNRPADPAKAHVHSDDDSDLEDESVLKSNLQPFYDPTNLSDDDGTAKTDDIEPTHGVTVKEKTGRLKLDKLFKNEKKRDIIDSEYIKSDVENTHNFPGSEEVVPDSMTDDTDEKPPMIPLFTRSPPKTAFYDSKKSPSKHKEREPTEKEIENKPVEARRSTRGRSFLLLQESNEVDSSSSIPRKARKKVSSQATSYENTESLGMKMLAEDNRETKPVSEPKKEQNLSDTGKKEVDCSLDKNEKGLKVSLEKQKSSESFHRASRKRKATTIRTENNVTTTSDRGMACIVSETIVQKTRAKGKKILSSDEQEVVSYTPVIKKSEISEPVTRKTRRSVAFKTQDLDVRDTTDERTRLMNEVSDHQNISSDKNNMALPQSVVKKAVNSIESDETASIASSVNDSDNKFDEEKKEEKINEKKGRNKKIRKEDSIENNIDDSAGPRVSSRGRRISTNPYLKDFETHGTKNKQRSVSLSHGEETNTGNKINSRKRVSETNDLGKDKRKATSDATKVISEKLCNSMGPPQHVDSRSKQVKQIDTNSDDDMPSENIKASKFKSPGQSILTNEIAQERTPTKKIARSTRTGRKSTHSKKIENLSLLDSLQAGCSDLGQHSETSSKQRKSVNNSVSSGLASSGQHLIEERLMSDECKSSRKSRHSTLQNDSTRSHQQLRTQNIVMPPEFQTPNAPLDEDQHLEVTVKSNTRVRKSMLADSVNNGVMESGKSSARLTKDKGNKVAEASQVNKKSRIKKQSETQAQVSVSPTKKSKLISSPQTPVAKTEICKVNSNSPALRKSSMSHKPRVMFTGLTDEQLEKIVKDLGGEMASSIQECTHLVTDKIRRTVKFLSGLAKGLFIVSPRWLESCKQAGTFIDGRMFLVSDPAMEKQYKFSLATSINKALSNPLLTGYKVHVSKSVKPEPAQMHDVLTCAGAEFLSSMPNKLQDNTVVISCPEDHKLCQPAIKMGIPVVGSEFILTGILRQELDFESFVLFTEKHLTQQSRKSKTSR